MKNLEAEFPGMTAAGFFLVAASFVAIPIILLYLSIRGYFRNGKEMVS